MIRVAVHVTGVVQGVGFRPFVYGAATQRGLAGWVANRCDGVRLEVEGERTVVRDFLAALARDGPPAADVTSIEVAELAPAGLQRFRVVESVVGTARRPTLPADFATCDACRAETRDPGARRHRYPFTNCTRCGPRYTVIESLPYDRARTAMRRFRPCAACAREYADPGDRRFHAEPIACPACGPVLRLVDRENLRQAEGDAAVGAAAQALAGGLIVAMKGLGGFQLLTDATNADAVARLRARKRRPHKPFAVLFATAAAVRAACRTTRAEDAVLVGPAAPIVLVHRRSAGDDPAAPAIAAAVAPGSPWLGAMLPATPLHALVAEAVDRPLVCTSGNLAEEPLCIDDDEARARLGAIADLFLVHDRPIVRPVDDSVVRIGPRGPMVLRRARGFAPLPLRIVAGRNAPTVLALGAQLKSTVALHLDGEVVVSQHLGDLHSVEGSALLERTVDDLLAFFAVRPARLACDLHPDYASTRLAIRLADAWGVPLERVQHHHAHVAACVAEHGLTGPVLGLAWDGAGLGADGTLWGGEALLADGARCTRVGHLRPFPLPGGEQAVREPRRAALGLLHALGGDLPADAVGHLFTAGELRVLLRLLDAGVQTAVTSSVGRLFDGVAALLGVGAGVSYEGQAATAVEVAAAEAGSAEPYPFPLGDGVPAVADWGPLVHAVLHDRRRGVPVARSAARFHAALAALAAALAVRIGLPRVVLAGGCFQNALLVEAVRTQLVAAGFTVHLPERYPPNDGGIALGQALVAIRRAQEEDHVSRHPG